MNISKERKFISKEDETSVKEVNMKKFFYLAFLAGVLLVFSTGNGFIQNDALPSTVGVRLDGAGFCNDLYLVCTMLDSKIYDCHGYEYGCGYNDRIAHGALRVAGGYAYFGVSKEMPGGGFVSHEHITIQISTKTGTFDYGYFQESSGGVTSWTGTASCTLTVGNDPMALNPSGAVEHDTSIR